MKTKLDFEDVLSELQQTEPDKVTEPSTVSVRLGESWSVGAEPDSVEPVDAYVSVGSEEYQLSATTLQSLAYTMSIGQDMLFASPGELVEPLMNYWLKTVEPEDGPSFYIKDGVAKHIVKPVGAMPKPPSYYASCVRRSIREMTGKDAWVSFWVENTEEQVNIVFGVRSLTYGFGGSFDTVEQWTPGIGLTMSSTGKMIPVVYGTLINANTGAVVRLPETDFKYSRKKDGLGVENTTTWIETSVGVLYPLLEKSTKMLDKLIKYDATKHTSGILNDILSEVSLPKPLKAKVIENIVDTDDESGYGLLLAILETVDFSQDEYNATSKVARAAGKLWAVLDNRCNSCHQLFH